jgi:hypothetical protein
MPVDGTPKFSTLSVAEIQADFKGSNVVLTCKAGFVDRNTNVTHGWTRGEGAVWSRTTIDALVALREAMEQDLAAKHFVEYSATPTGVSHTPPERIGGIGEFLNEAEQG